MENREIEFTVKANTKPIEASMQKLVTDISLGEKNMADFAEEIESMNSIKIDKLTDALSTELKASKLVVKEIKAELDKLNQEKNQWTYPPTQLLKTIEQTSNELSNAKQTALNLSDALTEAKIGGGEANMDKVFAEMIPTLKEGITDMTVFDALLENAEKHELKDITSNLRAGLENAEIELQD